MQSKKNTLTLWQICIRQGLIDDQVHFREPGLTHKGNIATEIKSRLAGGVTSYFEMPNVNPTHNQSRIYKKSLI